MKLILTFSFLVLSLNVFAQDEGKFAEHKKMMLEGMTHQMEALQSTKSCVEAAGDGAAIKKCHEVAKAERIKMKTEKIGGKIKKLEAEKKNMEEKK